MLAELERGAGSLRTMVSVHNSLVAHTILSLGTDEQRTRLLPQLASGDTIGAFCLTEPDAGSNPAQMRASVRLRDDRCWVLRGEKTFITNANLASIFLVFAREHDGRISAFAVEAPADGLVTTPLKGKLGLRASDTGSFTWTTSWSGPDRKAPHGLQRVRVVATARRLANLLCDAATAPGTRLPLPRLVQSHAAVG